MKTLLHMLLIVFGLTLVSFCFLWLLYLASSHKIPLKTNLSIVISIIINIGVLFFLMHELKKKSGYSILLKRVINILIIFFVLILLYLFYLEFLAIISYQHTPIDMRVYNWIVISVNIVIILFLKTKLKNIKNH